LWSVANVASVVGVGGTRDWAWSATDVYFGHSGRPPPFGSPVLANCVQYFRIAAASCFCTAFSCGCAGGKRYWISLPWDAP
jgi:hypothetical protein